MTVQAVSKELNIPKDTLRYYDKIGLVTPKRSESGYRYYSSEDILNLKYVEALKYADFTLGEIKQFFDYKSTKISVEDCDKVVKIFEDKKQEYIKKINSYNTMISLVDEVLEMKKSPENLCVMGKANQLVTNVFNYIKGKRG